MEKKIAKAKMDSKTEEKVKKVSDLGKTSILCIDVHAHRYGVLVIVLLITVVNLFFCSRFFNVVTSSYECLLALFPDKYQSNIKQKAVAAFAIRSVL